MDIEIDAVCQVDCNSFAEEAVALFVGAGSGAWTDPAGGPDDAVPGHAVGQG